MAKNKGLKTLAGVVIAVGAALGITKWIEARNNARLEGVVTDVTTNLPIQGIKVLLDGKSATTNNNGDFALSVPAGTYDLRFTDPQNRYEDYVYQEAT